MIGPSSLVFTFAVIVSLIYIVLGFMARSHVSPENKDRLSKLAPVYFYYWPFYGNLFAPSAQGLRRLGWFLFPLMMIGYVLAVVLNR